MGAREECWLMALPLRMCTANSTLPDPAAIPMYQKPASCQSSGSKNERCDAEGEKRGLRAKCHADRNALHPRYRLLPCWQRKSRQWRRYRERRSGYGCWSCARAVLLRKVPPPGALWPAAPRKTRRRMLPPPQGECSSPRPRWPRPGCRASLCSGRSPSSRRGSKQQSKPLCHSEGAWTSLHRAPARRPRRTRRRSAPRPNPWSLARTGIRRRW
mmetsp:Transcript_7524/g.19040  ORF Transcript_7524/g.19040 Transcript_7524/m.19040 type:complete len:214 (+) Transcript_7524:127-768(+)